MPTAATDEAADARVVSALRQGDEGVFADLVRAHDAGLRRMARLYVDDATADEVVQDTWATVVRGIDRFEGRSTLKTWIYGILVNVARRRGQREGRTIPFASMGSGLDGWNGAVAADRLQHPELGAGYWSTSPSWARDPQDTTLSTERRAVVRQAIAALTPPQREVVSLRDLEGWSAAEVCEVLGISDTSQRTLLHRGRVSVRRALEDYLNA